MLAQYQEVPYKFTVSDVALDPLGHHTVLLAGGVSGLTPDDSHTHPADVLEPGWERGKPASSILR